MFDISYNNEFVIFTNNQNPSESYYFRKGCGRYYTVYFGTSQRPLVAVTDGEGNELIVDYTMISTPVLVDNDALMQLLSGTDYFRSCGGGGGGGGGSVILFGDVIGPSGSNTINSLQGQPLVVGTPSVGDVLTWNGTTWVSAPASGAFPPGDINETIRYAAANFPVATSNLYNQDGTIIPGIPQLHLRMSGAISTLNAQTIETFFGSSNTYYTTSLIGQHPNLAIIYSESPNPMFLFVEHTTVVGKYQYPGLPMNLPRFSNIFGGFGVEFSSGIGNQRITSIGGSSTYFQNVSDFFYATYPNIEVTNTLANNVFSNTRLSSAYGVVLGVKCFGSPSLNNTNITFRDVYDASNYPDNFTLNDSRQVKVDFATFNIDTSNPSDVSFVDITNSQMVVCNNLFTFDSGLFAIYKNLKIIDNGLFNIFENDYTGVQSLNSSLIVCRDNFVPGFYAPTPTPSLVFDNASGKLLQFNFVDEGSNASFINDRRNIIMGSTFRYSTVQSFDTGVFLNCLSVFKRSNSQATAYGRAPFSCMINENLTFTATSSAIYNDSLVMINVQGLYANNFVDNAVMINANVLNDSGDNAIIQGTFINCIRSDNFSQRGYSINTNDCEAKNSNLIGFIGCRDITVTSVVNRSAFINVEPGTTTNIDVNLARQSNTVFVEELGLATSNTSDNKRTCGIVSINQTSGGWSVTINTSRANNQKLIMLTPRLVTGGSAHGLYVSNIIDGGSFTISSAFPFTGEVSWMIVNTLTIDT